jgi:hypothetical protein
MLLQLLSARVSVQISTEHELILEERRAGSAAVGGARRRNDEGSLIKRAVLPNSPRSGH